MKKNIYLALWASFLGIYSSIAAWASNIPSNFIATPAGYVHPECINVLEDGEKINDDGTILQKNGSNRSPVNCSYPKYMKNGTEIIEGTSLSDTVEHSWEASLSNKIDENNGIIRFVGEWDVPQHPYLYENQTLFAFNSIRTHNSIIQPVLGFNQSGATGPQWSIASWAVVNGVPYKSQTIRVNSGDRIRGEMTREIPDGVAPKTIKNWNVSISILKGDQETQKQTLPVTLKDSSYTYLDNAAYETYRDRDIIECLYIAKQKDLKPMAFTFTTTKVIWKNNTSGIGKDEKIIYDRDCNIQTSIEGLFLKTIYKIFYLP